MQVKDQRITRIKQKYGPKFEPIMFTVEEAPATGSISVRLSTEGGLEAPEPSYGDWRGPSLGI